jgi:RimJ/RimL family protein N-acetyltransferase
MARTRARLKDLAHGSLREAGMADEGFAGLSGATGELIGDCAAGPHDGDVRQAEIGFTIAPGYQGRGFATEAACCLLG